MSELDQQLNAIISNPQMMQQIMSIAQSLNASGGQKTAPEQPEPHAAANYQGISPSILNKVSSVMQRGTIDQNQQSLLKALSPYLSRAKIQKLERAMHAAKMAGIASEFLNSSNHHQ